MGEGLLTTLAAVSRERAARLDRRDLAARAASAPPARLLDLTGPGFDVIAEVKLASPSAGTLADVADGATAAYSRAVAYAAAGAVAVSILTEPTRFAGDLAHVARAAAAPVPVMRKDFLVDATQVLEARAYGASGVLLIVRLVEDDVLADQLAMAAEQGMFALVECFDAEDVDRAGPLLESTRATTWLGVNCRDLDTLAVDADRFATLALRLRGQAVAESGVETPEDAAAVARLGYRAALVGTALMRSPNPGERLAALIAAGRSA